MRARYVKEFAEGARVDAALVLRSKEMRTARTGEAYLSVQLADKTGSIRGVHFAPGSTAMAVPVGAVVDVRGRITTFRNSRQIAIESLRPAVSWNAEDLMSASPRPEGELVSEFSALVKSVRHARLRALLREVFGNRSFFERFMRCPGSQSYHHAYLGGLLEHTISVADQCAVIAHRYDGVDRDLLVACALLHDVGKVDELSYDTAFGYTDEGRLLGHVVLGARAVREAAKRAGVPDALLIRLEHAMLSHHGELEWGSPKRPSTIEALVLHHVDNLDAKAAGFSQICAGAVFADEAWTDSANLYRRPLFAPRPVEDDRSHLAEDDAQHLRQTA